jgi:large subunit ribosomal protein L15
MYLHNLKTSRKRKKPQRGRGIGSRRGAKSGRGQKGQKSRSGGRLRRGFEGGRSSLMQHFPKKRGIGYKNPRSRTSRFYAESVTLEQIDKAYKAGDLVTPKTLFSHDLIKTARGGAKIVVRGKLSKKLRFRNVSLSAQARKAVTADGSTVEAAPSVAAIDKSAAVEKKRFLKNKSRNTK